MPKDTNKSIPINFYGGRESWISECGQFVAIYYGDDILDCDVVSRDGHVWRGRRYRPTGWGDKDPRYVYPEFPKMVAAWTNRSRQRRDGTWTKAFALSFADYDQTVRWRETSGSKSNEIEAEFLRRVPPLHPRRWVRDIIDNYQLP